ncbi:Required for respiratory growth protein 7, mitochondrial [Pichia californica]|uniref:Required for respiratory growth protein 7, mitochondrial n=1 Tax=Pichia californica TaxID=460514 RepID=A0A9P6WJD2_9ASCO|nr:Required for respiratory growth protein 7, mitochondrial [[Candida] californica]KAG0687133.1 Required for respiratory growth protein 7, mitochondrial [[Candida] californica]
MLVLDFALLSKASAKTAPARLTGIQHATRINNLVAYTRMLNTTNPKNKEIKDIKIQTGITKKRMDEESNPKSKLKLERGKRPRGRPPKKDSKTSLINGKNISTLLDHYDTPSSYLDYAASRSSPLKPTSSVFVGNLYELQVKAFLEQSFKIRSTLHQGGSNDKGIDINAIWNPVDIFSKDTKSNKNDSKESPKYEIVNSKKIKPLVSRLKKTLKLFVQCKCFDSSKIDPKLIREIKGSCQEYFSKNGNSAVFMIASTNGFTKIGREDFDKAPIPLIYAEFSKPRLIDVKIPYKIESWDMCRLEGMSLNPMASALFKDLNWVKFSNKVTS